MTTLDQAWINTQADDGYGEDNIPPAGYLGVVRITGTRAGQSKKGESYFAVDLKDDTGGYNWSIYKEFTKSGQPNEGRIKSAKITLRQLGLEVASPAHLPALLSQIEGRYFTAEQVASDRINTVTGQAYVNTNITGVASAPAPAAPPAPAPQVQVPAGVPTLDQVLAANPAALPVGNADDHPFD